MPTEEEIEFFKNQGRLGKIKYIFRVAEAKSIQRTARNLFPDVAELFHVPDEVWQDTISEFHVTPCTKKDADYLHCVTDYFTWYSNSPLLPNPHRRARFERLNRVKADDLLVYGEEITHLLRKMVKPKRTETKIEEFLGFVGALKLVQKYYPEHLGTITGRYESFFKKTIEENMDKIWRSPPKEDGFQAKIVEKMKAENPDLYKRVVGSIGENSFLGELFYGSLHQLEWDLKIGNKIKYNEGKLKAVQSFPIASQDKDLIFKGGRQIDREYFSRPT